jgi:hypothetical protein
MRRRADTWRMARKTRARDLPMDRTASDAGTISPGDRAAIITNIWTLTSRSAKQIGKAITGESTGAPPPALRALFRASGQR